MCTFSTTARVALNSGCLLPSALWVSLDVCPAAFRPQTANTALPPWGKARYRHRSPPHLFLLPPPPVTSACLPIVLRVQGEQGQTWRHSYTWLLKSFWWSLSSELAFPKITAAVPQCNPSMLCLRLCPKVHVALPTKWVLWESYNRAFWSCAMSLW